MVLKYFLNEIGVTNITLHEGKLLTKYLSQAG